jgi:hypothetical protein
MRAAAFDISLIVLRPTIQPSSIKLVMNTLVVPAQPRRNCPARWS